MWIIPPTAPPPTTSTVPASGSRPGFVAPPPPTRRAALPLPAESLASADNRALVQSLEAIVGRANRLRSAIGESQITLDGLVRELQQHRDNLETSKPAAARLRTELASSEADLRQVQIGLRELETQQRQAARNPSPPPRTLPLVKPDRSGNGPTDPEDLQQLHRAEAALAQRIHQQRQQLSLADRSADDAARALLAKAAEVDRQRRALVRLREELAQLPSDAEVAAGLAAASAAGQEGPKPSALALSDIPGDHLNLYRRAALTCRGLPWTVLAAIGSVESSHGRTSAPGVRSGANFAGAMGPMQFLAETWAAYGVDADGSGAADVYHSTDAVFGAAKYLCHSGAGDPTTLAKAIWAYNHADWYVADVLSRAAAYGIAGLGTAPADVAALVDHPNLTVTAEGRADLLSGTTDDRVVAALSAAVAEHRIEVTVIKTGHSQFVRGTDRISNHYHGRGVDISKVDGVPVSISNQAALRLAAAFLTAEGSLRPDELGSPWPELAQFPGAFSDADHAGHLHLGWRSNPPEFHQVKDSVQ
jgi:hypothetical protein